MKALVTGGRDFEHFDSLWLVLDWVFSGTPYAQQCLIHGACGWDLAKDGPPRPYDLKFLRKLRGADKYAHLYALNRRIEVRPHPADWSRGPSGGPKRNEGMFVAEAPNIVVAAPGGSGTANMVSLAKNAGTMVLEVTPWR